MPACLSLASSNMSAASSEAPPLPPPEERSADWKRSDGPAVGKAKAKGRPKKARIDIDHQIDEANVLANMLKKVQSRARNMKKTGQRSKKRLMAKASRLSQVDLERIAMLKRFGMVPLAEPEADSSEVCATPPKIARSRHSENLRQSITDQLGGLLKMSKSQGSSCEEPSASDAGAPPLTLTASALTLISVSPVRLSSGARLGRAGSGAVLTDIAPIAAEDESVVEVPVVGVATPLSEKPASDAGDEDEDLEGSE